MADNSHFPITQGQLCALFVESVLYGTYAVTCGFCATALLRTDSPRRWKRANEIKWIVMIAGLALLANSTINVALAYYRVSKAFIFSPDPVAEMSKVSSWANVGKTATYAMQPVIGDFILIYRCYVVYSQNWKIIVPSLLLWVGGVVCAGKTIEMQARLHIQATVNAADIRAYSLAFSSITVSQNIITSSLLVWRLWSVEHENRQFNSFTATSSGHRTSALMRVIRIITESGLLITMGSFMTLVCRASLSNAIYPSTAIEMMTIPIAFNLIIIRTSGEQRIVTNTTATYGQSIPLHFRPHVSTTTSNNTTGAPPKGRDFQVVVTQDVARDHEVAEGKDY